MTQNTRLRLASLSDAGDGSIETADSVRVVTQGMQGQEIEAFYAAYSKFRELAAAKDLFRNAFTAAGRACPSRKFVFGNKEITHVQLHDGAARE